MPCSVGLPPGQGWGSVALPASRGEPTHGGRLRIFTDKGWRRQRLYKPFKEGYRNLCLGLRLLRAADRRLPDFLIIGVQKAGTTSLFNYLAEHPQIDVPLRKEVHYFDVRYERSERWYRAHFPPSSTLGQTLTGEASPAYLFYEGVEQRVAELLPEVKLIVLLRDPVHRAYSHYQQSGRKGFETLDFSAAMRAEAERLAAPGEPLLRDRVSGTVALRKYSYLIRGHYAEQLERWFALFPRERFLIMKSEEMFADPQQTCDQVFDFLDLPPHRLQQAKVHNEGRYDRDRLPGEDELRTYFAPHNARLAELLGRDMGW